MRKSKIMKALLVFGMSVVTATAMVGFAACDKPDTSKDDDKQSNVTDDTNNDGTTPAGHSHSWSAWTPVADDNTKHQHECTADGHTGDKVVTAPHGTANSEGKCPDCGYQLVTGGEKPTPTEDVVINIKDITATIENGTTLGEGVSVTVLDGKTAPSISESGGKRPLVAGEEVTTATSRMTLPSNKNSGIKLDLAADATVIVYANGANGDDRTLGLYSDLSGTPTQTLKVNATSNDLDAVFFNVKGGETCYIGASNNLYIFYIIVSYNTVNETATLVGAPTCTEAGNSVEHYKTNYGRYYTESGSTKTYVSIGDIKKTAQNKLGHSYSVKADSLVVPTDDAATNPGKVVLHCGTCQHDEEVALPVLSSDKYTQTPIAGSDNVTYSITLSEMPDTPVTFEAAPVASVETQWTNVFAPSFGDLPTEIGKDNAVSVTGGKIYYTKNKDTDKDTDPSVTSDGVTLSVTGANAYCDLDEAITSGLVKISGKINVKATNTGWTFLQLKDSAGKEVFGIRAQKDVGLIPRYMGTEDTSTVIATTYANQEIAFEITIDCTSKKVSLKWGGTLVINEAGLTGDVGYQSLMLNVNTGRTVTLEDLVIAVPQA